MSVETASSKVKIEDFLQASSGQLVPVNSQFSYFCTPSMPEEDLRQFLHEPIAALPQALCALLPKMVIMLVPYLEKLPGKGGVRISFERVAEASQAWSWRFIAKDTATLFFSVKDEEISEYHYSFYNEISSLVASDWPNEVRDAFLGVVRGELAGNVHGEVDEKSWHMKQTLLRRGYTKDAKGLRAYGKQAFEDTLTLYLHGLCCDIDVETGPRQMPGRWVRKRLETLHSLFPPPPGHAAFPEEVNRVTR